MWLSVRGQRPYHAPAGWALALLIALAAVALAVAAQVRDRAAQHDRRLRVGQRVGL